MRNEIEYQDLGWAPLRYPTYSAIDTGEWRIVYDDDAPVGVVWTNRAAGAGITWLKQTDLVKSINKMFLLGAESGMPAYQAYGAVESKYESNLGPVKTGDLTGIEESFTDIMEEIDEATNE